MLNTKKGDRVITLDGKGLVLVVTYPASNGTVTVEDESGKRYQINTKDIIYRER